MPEVASVFQKAQIGLESTPGTGVAAGKVMQSWDLKPAIEADIIEFRAQGNKFATVAALGKEWMSASINGVPDFNELTWLLNSALVKVTPTGASTDKTWTMAPALSAPDTVATYTVEYGSSVRAGKFAHGLVDSLALKFGRGGNTLSGSMFGMLLQDAITMTSTPTAAAQMPILPTYVSVYLADTYAGLAGASALLRVMDCGWNVAGRFAALWALNAAVTSFATYVETVPQMGMTLKLEADTEGMALLTSMRAGSAKFMRIKAVGPLIGAGVYHTLQLDMCGKVLKPSTFEDVDGVYAIEWPFQCNYDATWGKAFEAKLINTIAAL